MKKLAFTICTVIVLSSCGVSKTVRDSKKVIKGEWTLNSVNYNESGVIKFNLLNDASRPCFEGSTWKFVPNNNTGVYTINKNNCNVGQRYFVFTIAEINQETGLYDFLIKPTNSKYKSETNQGVRFRLLSLSNTDMQWEQTVIINEKPFPIKMNFIKNKAQ